MSIRVVIVGDTHAHCQELAASLAEDERLEVIWAGAEISYTGRVQAHVDVALAVALPYTQALRFACPVVALSDAASPARFAGGSLRAWLPLSASIAEVSASLFAAACDLSVFTSEQLPRWTPAAQQDDDGEAARFVEKLTPRELQVLRLLADGLGNKEIAGQLGLSDHTAKFHVTQILAKLGAGSRTEAVMIGIRRGLVPL